MLKSPRLTGMAVENYRSFVKQTDIELRPLTMFFGHNSAGKSALVRFLPFLADSSKYAEAYPLNFQSEAMRGANFADIRCRLLSTPSFVFELKWEGEVASAQYTIRDLAEYHRQIVDCLIIRDRSGNELLRCEWVPQSQNGLVSREYRITGSEISSQDISFRGLLPEVINGKVSKSTANLLGQLRERLDTLAHHTTWLQALRSLPPRQETLNASVGRLRPDGSGITQMLAYDDLAGGPMLQTVSEWYTKATGTKLEIRWGVFAGKDMFSLVLSPNEGLPMQVDIVDTGEGMGQVLPILGALSFAMHDNECEKSIYAIEHPELHLHPSAHPYLAWIIHEGWRA